LPISFASRKGSWSRSMILLTPSKTSACMMRRAMGGFSAKVFASCAYRMLS
jgi:hypothetical protein